MADELLKNLIIVIAALSLGLMVGIGIVVYFIWKSGMLGLVTKATGIPNPEEAVPPEAMDAAKEAGGEPAAAPTEEKKKPFFRNPFKKAS